MAFDIDSATGFPESELEDAEACEGEGHEVEIDEDGFAICDVCEIEWGVIHTDETKAIIPRHKVYKGKIQ